MVVNASSIMRHFGWFTAAKEVCMEIFNSFGTLLGAGAPKGLASSMGHSWCDSPLDGGWQESRIQEANVAVGFNARVLEVRAVPYEIHANVGGTTIVA